MTGSQEIVKAVSLAGSDERLTGALSGTFKKIDKPPTYLVNTQYGVRGNILVSGYTFNNLCLEGVRTIWCVYEMRGERG